MTTLLVANRGEVARRIFGTARRMGLRTVAVYSDVDAGAAFTSEADRAIRIGPGPAAESYLSVERIVAAARQAGADLIHPGYGFLAEDAAFARAVATEGLRFVGPPPEVLAALGDKAVAKDIAERAGVPVIPGYRGADQSDDAFASAAREVGFPLLVKPVGGGGGIGMQLVDRPESLRDELARARRIARAAFGNEDLLIERALARPRHVEVQILADTHGSVLTLGDRDCSAQRRRQKVVEEAPAPNLPETMRASLHQAAIAIARAAGYVNAGTVEFLVERESFWFIEVNARLQVEHPVTEEVLGVDIVEQQLRIVLGERLGNLPTRPRGHAIEARVYAEDSAAGFLPSTGRAIHVRWPAAARVDSSVEEGGRITADYDPLVAKIVVRGDDRAAALEALTKALDETEILGVRTNLGFLRSLVAHPVMRAGPPDVDFIGRSMAELVPGVRPPTDGAWALGAIASIAGTPARDPWLEPWRVSRGAVATVVLHAGDRERAIEIEGRGPWRAAGHRVAQGDEPHRFTIDGAPACAARDLQWVWVGLAGEVHELGLGARERHAAGLARGGLIAPMPGRIVAAHATAGRPVKRGDLLFVLEAMKMELRIESPADGVIKRSLVGAGDVVQRGQPLAELEEGMGR